MPAPSSIPWRLTIHDTVESTNDLALASALLAWQNNTSPHGIVHIAAAQSRGRGQHQRPWLSPSGGLYLSAIVEHIPPQFRDRLALVVGAAVASALIHLGHAPITLRWPNDVLLDNKKIAGILCESLSHGSHFATIVGIGLNINTPASAFPPGLQPLATSLLAHTGSPQEVAPIQSALLAHLADAFTQLPHTGLAPTLAFARTHDALLHKHLTLTTPGGPLEGTAQGLDNDGSLLLNTPDGPRSLPIASLTHINGQSLRKDFPSVSQGNSPTY